MIILAPHGFASHFDSHFAVPKPRCLLGYLVVKTPFAYFAYFAACHPTKARYNPMSVICQLKRRYFRPRLAPCYRKSPRLAAFQDAVFVRPNQRHVVAFAQILVAEEQADAVAKRRDSRMKSFVCFVSLLFALPVSPFTSSQFCCPRLPIFQPRFLPQRTHPPAPRLWRAGRTQRIGSVLNSGARLYKPQHIPMQSKPLRVADPRSEKRSGHYQRI